MSKYTTGELAKLCSVTVRTVQYYDTRGILVPSELSEGGRRLYSGNDLKRMRIICFLRGLGISISSISELMTEEDDPEGVISALIAAQERTLRAELDERQKKLNMLDDVRRELKNVPGFSVYSIADIAYAMENKNKMKRLHAALLVTGIPVSVLQCAGIILWILRGIWQLFRRVGGCRRGIRRVGQPVLFQKSCLYLPAVPHSLQAHAARGVLGAAHAHTQEAHLHLLRAQRLLRGDILQRRERKTVARRKKKGKASGSSQRDCCLNYCP